MKKITKSEHALLVDFATWMSTVRQIDVDSPEHAVERFIEARAAGENITEVFVLVDADPDGSGRQWWWIYVPGADSWICFTFGPDGDSDDSDLDEVLTQVATATTVASTFRGFDQGAADIIARFGVMS